MIQDDKGPGPAVQIGLAVAIAALSTLASSLVVWGVDELRAKLGSKQKEKKNDLPPSKETPQG